MSVTNLLEVQDQIQTFWSPMFMDELRESTILPSLVNREYEGAINGLGDTVRVSQIKKAAGELLTIGTDGTAEVFHPEKMVTAKVDVVANKRAVASFKVGSLVDIQSQIGAEKSSIRDALMQGVLEQINDYLYSLVSPSTATPDHLIASNANLSAADLIAYRVLAGQAKWLKDNRWWALLDPLYYGDLLGESTVTSSEFNGGEVVTLNGEIVQKRFGFNIVEDNSRSVAQGLFFHPDFMYLVTQLQPTFKVSDLHSNEQFGYLISVDTIFGATLGLEGSIKHILSKAAA